MKQENKEIIEKALSMGFKINGNQAKTIAREIKKNPEKEKDDIIWNTCADLGNKKFNMGLSKH